MRMGGQWKLLRIEFENGFLNSVRSVQAFSSLIGKLDFYEKILNFAGHF
jgi:hypothetical protein